MNDKEKRRRIVSAMNGVEVPVVGSVCYWNVTGVDVTKDQFVQLLKEVGLPEKYAREHNYRSAFIRALKNLEEDRIIRRVSEDEAYIVYQFTAENVKRTEGEKTPILEYRYETRVIVDKDRYYKTRNFSDALVKDMPGYVADPEVSKKVIELYERERTRYRSGDVTRYVQRILSEEADIVALRDRGAVYFVPARFQDVIEKVKSLVDRLAMGSSFEFLPIPDAAGSRGTVARSVIEDIRIAIEEFSAQIRQTTPETPKYMIDRFESRVDEIKRRIGFYDDIVPESESKKLSDQVDIIAQRVFAARRIEV